MTHEANPSVTHSAHNDEPTPEQAALYSHVSAAVASLPPHQRPHHALILTPEDGAVIVTRAVLAHRLRLAGLEKQARDVWRMAKSANELLCWSEAEDPDGAAEAGLSVLRGDRHVANARRKR